MRRFPSLRSSLRSSSTVNDDHQPLIARRPSVQSQSTNYSQSHASKCSTALSQSENLLPIEEEERDKPTFDRSVDLVAIAAPHEISIDQTEVFEQLVSAYDEQNGEHRLSALPAAVRHKIYTFCFEGFERRKINLSPKFAVRAVFPDSYFVSPWNVLDPVFGGIHAFRALRHDLMTYFWTAYHFHVTLNVFSGPVFSPLSHVWLLNFLDRIQRLTIEVDFTRFGGSSMRLAPAFGHNNDKLEDLLLGLIRGLKERPGRLTMAELNLMCRRYGGFRSKTEELGSSTVKYCPDDEIHIFDMMSELHGILQRCRVSGFTPDYTKQLLSAAFADGDQEVEFITPNGPAWPHMPSLDVNAPVYTSNLHPNSALLPEPFSLRLHHSRSFAQEFEEEIERLDEETYRHDSISNYIASSLTGALLEDQGHGLGNGDSDGIQQYSNVRGSILSTASTQLGTPMGASTPRFEQLQPGEIMCTRTYEISQGTRTPPPERSSRPNTPNTPNTLNKLNERDPAFVRTLNALKTQSQIEANEQDPAFIRTVEAMRKNSQTDAPAVASENKPPFMFMPTTATVVESPAQRSASALSARTNESKGVIKRRYLSFIDKVRGRAES